MISSTDRKWAAEPISRTQALTYANNRFFINEDTSIVFISWDMDRGPTTKILPSTSLKCFFDPPACSLGCLVGWISALISSLFESLDHMSHWSANRPGPKCPFSCKSDLHRPRKPSAQENLSWVILSSRFKASIIFLQSSFLLETFSLVEQTSQFKQWYFDSQLRPISALQSRHWFFLEIYAGALLWIVLFLSFHGSLKCRGDNLWSYFHFWCSLFDLPPVILASLSLQWPSRTLNSGTTAMALVWSPIFSLLSVAPWLIWKVVSSHRSDLCPAPLELDYSTLCHFFSGGIYIKCLICPLYSRLDGVSSSGVRFWVWREFCAIAWKWRP